MALTTIKTGGLADNSVTDAKVANAITITGAQTGITQVGTISAGTWQGTPITSAYLNAAQTAITSVGTLTSLTVSGAPFVMSNTNNGNNIDIKTTSSGSLVHAVKIHSHGLFEAKQGVSSTTATFTGAVNVTLSDASVSPSSDADDLVVESNGACGITIASANNSIGSLRFADSGASHAGMIYYSHASNFMKFYTDATERMIIDSAGKVGIGNSIPSSFDDEAENLVVGTGSGNQGITIYAGTSSRAKIHFADGASGTASYRGMISYDHNSDFMSFATSNAERMRITSAGNVMLGNQTMTDHTNQTLGLKGTSQSGVSAITFLTTSSPTAGRSFAWASNYTAHGSFDLRCSEDKDGTPFHGRILGIEGDTGNATFAGKVTATGIQFDANGEILDDYEEGTWSPNNGNAITVVGSFTSGGYYVKIGNHVWVRGWVKGSTSIAVSGANVMTLLPFQIDPTYTTNHEIMVTYGNNVVSGVGYAWSTAIYGGYQNFTVSANSAVLNFQLDYYLA